MRLSFAFMVLYSHCYPLALGSNEQEPLSLLSQGWLTMGGVAVDGFFLISGYLITQSWIRSKSTADFVVRRFLRIYPGYWAALAFSLLVGVAASQPRSSEYIKNVYYDNDSLVRSFLFLGYGAIDQPQVFEANPFPGAVNGSLWTLQIELQCYALIMVLGIFGLANNKRFTAIVFLLAFTIYSVNLLHLWGSHIKITRFLTFFFFGASVANGWLFHRFSSLKCLIACLIGLLLVTSMPSLLPIIYVPVFAYSVFCLAFAKWNPAARWISDRDFSYGVYLYAFPIQQVLVWTLDTDVPWILFLTALPPTMAMAFCSWKMIEKPAISRSKAIIQNLQIGTMNGRYC